MITAKIANNRTQKPRGVFKGPFERPWGPPVAPVNHADNPGRDTAKIPAPVKLKSGSSPDEIIGLIHEVIAELSQGRPTIMDPPEWNDRFNRLSELCAALGRTGPTHVLQSTLANIVDVIHLLTIRMRTWMEFEIAVANVQEGTTSDTRRRLQLPATVTEKLLPGLDSLANMALRLVDAFQKVNKMKPNGSRREHG